jgi:hypothetical protein
MVSPFLLILVIVLVIWITWKSNVLPNTFQLIFAGDSINEACDGIGTTLTAYSSSPTLVADVFLYTTAAGDTPLQNGQYNYNGARMNIAGGAGQVVGLYGCA